MEAGAPVTWKDNNPYANLVPALPSPPMYPLERVSCTNTPPAPAPDYIDRMSNILPGSYYHHDGPYDAIRPTRQSVRYAPLDAVRDRAEKDLRYVPRGDLENTIRRHYPLQGTAVGPQDMVTREERDLRKKQQKEQNRKKIVRVGSEGFYCCEEVEVTEEEVVAKKGLKVKVEKFGGLVRKISVSLRKKNAKTCADF